MKEHFGKIVAFALCVALAPVAVASAQGDMGGMMPAGVKAVSTTAGRVLVDQQGMTLYTWGNDSLPGKSSCNGKCATNWPPLAAKADAAPMGDWTVITRDDGMKQWAYKGQPLYTFQMDKKAGDVTGNGKGKWLAAKP